MRKLFLFAIRFVASVIKGCAGLAIVAAIVLAVLFSRESNMNRCSVDGVEFGETEIRELQEACADKDRIIREQEQRIAELTAQLDEDLQIHWQMELQLLPELDLEWLEFTCFDVWASATREEFEGTAQGEQVVICSSALFRWSATNLGMTSDG